MEKENFVLEISGSKRMVDMDGRDLMILIQQVVKTELESKIPPSNDYSGVPKFVTGLKSLAATLKVSLSTVNRWKSEGLLDDVTFQNGKFVSFDVYGILDILRVSNQKSKFYNKNQK